MKLLLGLLVACAIITMGAWSVVAATVCSNPRAPVQETRHVIPYNCHGMTVYISNADDWLLHWSFPIFMLLSLIAATMALLTVVKVRINVQIKVNGTGGSSSDSDARHP